MALYMRAKVKRLSGTSNDGGTGATPLCLLLPVPVKCVFDNDFFLHE